MRGGGTMKVFLDDERPTPDGWVGVKTPKDAISLIITGDVDEISLDHDLGDDDGIGTGYDVLLFLEERLHLEKVLPPKVSVHTANSSAREKMLRAVASIEAAAAILSREEALEGALKRLLEYPLHKVVRTCDRRRAIAALEGVSTADIARREIAAGKSKKEHEARERDMSVAEHTDAQMVDLSATLLPISIHIPGHLLGSLKDLADSRGTSYKALLEKWIAQKIQEEDIS
jgi:hypothetical protein